MEIGLYAFFLSLGLSVAIFATVQQARATLGESSDSITLDRKALSAVRRAATVRNGYTVHEITSASTVVREYVSTSGIVFGIAWNGLIHPDLAASGHLCRRIRGSPLADSASAGTKASTGKNGPGCCREMGTYGNLFVLFVGAVDYAT